MPNSDRSCQKSSLHKRFSSRDKLKFTPCGTVKQSPAEHYSMLGFHRIIISPVYILIVGSWCLTQSSLVHWQCSHSFVRPPVPLSSSTLSSSLLLGLNFLYFLSFDTCMSLEHWNFTCQILIFFCSFVLLLLTQDPGESIRYSLSALPINTGRVGSSLPGMST